MMKQQVKVVICNIKRTTSASEGREAWRRASLLSLEAASPQHPQTTVVSSVGSVPHAHTKWPATTERARAEITAQQSNLTSLVFAHKSREPI